MKEQELIDFLNNMQKGDDEVCCHGSAEEELLKFLANNSYSKLANAYDAASRRVPFWYE